jgi:hypothetical protein
MDLDEIMLIINDQDELIMENLVAKQTLKATEDMAVSV